MVYAIDMATPIWPNAENCTSRELETAMRATPKQRSFIRMQAIRALIVGFDHHSVATLFQVHRDTITHWIRRFNEGGIDGLIERPRSGRPRKISPEQSEQYRQLVEQPQRAGVDHWTGKKFHGYLRKHLEHEVGYSTVLRWLHEHGFRLKVPQCWPDRQDEMLRQAFVEQLKVWLKDPHIDLWYLDEMGIEGDPRPRRRWVKKGEKPRVPYRGEHIRMSVSGMICPRSGQFYALEFTHTDSVVFQTFLDHANNDLQLQRGRNLLICDNAAWHRNKSIKWGQFEPAFLPPYSPDLNPIERLWLLIKAEWFTDFIAKDKDQLIKRLDQALLWAMDRHDDNKSTCAITEKL